MRGAALVTESEYFAAGTDDESERKRLARLQRLFDPHTFEFLERTGIGPGWQCLDLGAGGGSVSRWLAQRAGGSGKVVALDLDPRFLADLASDNIEVRQCDIRSDEIEPGRYDLVFTRLVLIHLHGDATVMSKLVEALKPGGWLVVEDLDVGTWRASEPDRPPGREFDSAMARAVQHDIDHGTLDPYFGGRLRRRFEELGLADIDIACRLSLEQGGSELSRFWHDTLAIDADTLVADAYLSGEQVEALLRAMLDPGFFYYPPAVLSIRGRKPDRPG